MSIKEKSIENQEKMRLWEQYTGEMQKISREIGDRYLRVKAQGKTVDADSFLWNQIMIEDSGRVIRKFSCPKKIIFLNTTVIPGYFSGFVMTRVVKYQELKQLTNFCLKPDVMLINRMGHISSAAILFWLLKIDIGREFMLERVKGSIPICRDNMTWPDLKDALLISLQRAVRLGNASEENSNRILPEEPSYYLKMSRFVLDPKNQNDPTQQCLWISQTQSGSN